MKTPVATYRIQLNREFDFSKLRDILPYLSRLGISHVYTSPILKARHGSPHGYDVTDHEQINDELGGLRTFEDLNKEAAAHGLELIQDIVPNHISYSPESKIISDVMEQGPDSRYYSFLDVNWNYPSPALKGRILAPFLEDSYEECLKSGQLELAYNEGFKIRYHNMKFPVRLSTYPEILKHASPIVLSDKNGGELKLTLQRLHRSDKRVRNSVKEAVERCNSDSRLLDKLLSGQIFALTHWTTALRRINYRRFFDLSELICLCSEEKDVFETTHRLTFELMTKGIITGLRIDHVDGLHDPEEYLEELRKRVPDAYIIVEKILMNGENLPDSWPVEGTTGYDFLNRVNGVFIDSNSEENLSALYRQFTRKNIAFSEILCRCKRLVIERYFGGDVENLTRMLSNLLRSRPYGERYSRRRLRKALIELLASFGVYRTYLTEKNTRKGEIERFKSVLLLAKRRRREVKDELTAIERLFQESNGSPDVLKFAMRLQQFTGAVMAKGLEDTTFYVYNRLLSLNEVGSDPAEFGCSTEDFHAFNRYRQGRWRFSLNATATHDTKRGEDVRARLNVLSEVPSEFRLQMRRWAGLNLEKKKIVDGKIVPDRNEEYYLYQTLLGAFPFDTTELQEFRDRLKTHIVKALREAKINSVWTSPNLKYEEAATVFVSQLLDSKDKNDFLDAFLPFQKKVAFYGFLNSLAQTLLKITSPGIPDFYQGAELWDFALVDPDNRRLVDFPKRQTLLRKIADSECSFREMLDRYQDGKVKLYVIYKSLWIRKKNRKLFEEGEYVPLTVKGKYCNHVVSFCRRKGKSIAVTVVPKFLTDLTRMPNIPSRNVWKDTYISLPRAVPKTWTEVFTQRPIFSRETESGRGLLVGELLETFPVALLLSGETYA